jgi:signal transduction histidine kinase
MGTSCQLERFSLEDVLITAELNARPVKMPDYAAENAALSELVGCLNASPGAVLQMLADKIISLTGADSSGISIEEFDAGKAVFRWHANGGEFAPYIGATMDRYNSPCGTVVDTDATQLMRVPERHYPFPQQPHKPIEEVLLIPFRPNTMPTGTVWAITHSKDKHFDNEDKRLLTSLSRFAAAAVGNLNNIKLLEKNVKTFAQESQQKTEFLAMLSHELRNPLAPIMTASQALRMMLPSSSAKELEILDIITRQSRQLCRIVDDLLDVSRAATNKLVLRTAVMNLSEAVRTAIESSQSSVEWRKHEFNAMLPSQDIHYIGDHSRIVQAVCNLLNNATRYTPEGGSIFLSLHRDQSDILIVVKDSGIGIAPDKIHSIFDIFDQGSKHRNAGLGLGLAIARRIIELHAGRIDVESEGVGQGAEFIIHLPAVATDSVKVDA